MSTAAAFSRLQLAAALLEYDNDPDDPASPYRSAQDSAIFAHLRRNPAARPDLVSRKSDHLGVALPSDSASLAGRESALDTRRSRLSKGSIDALRNPFGADTTSEYEGAIEAEEGEGLEVDLASWGLDAFMPKDKARSMKGKGKQPVPAVVSTSLRRPSTSYEVEATLPRRAKVTSKSASLGGNMEELQIDTSPIERRRSFGSPLDLAGMEPPNVPFHRPSAESQASYTSTDQVAVPFPTTSARSPSPGVENAYADSRPSMHNRAYSSASLNSRMILEGGREDFEGRQRNLSNDIAGMMKSQEEDNPFAIQNPSHISRFDPKSVSRARSHSNASLGSRMMLENDDRSVMTGDPYARERPLSTMELLRPKILVMPSPLQPITPQNSTQPAYQVRDGFELSADGPPLPAGARASRRLSSSMSFLEAENIPVASNSFTPNPLMDLSLSQKTFRNTLFVPGQASYLEGMNKLPRATEDGEQAELDPSGQEEPPKQPPPAEGPSKGSRPPGKLYGKSLIDDLEDRKLQMRSKQRVFTGDQRPSMMAREQHRASTLIDPASLQRKPTNERISSYGSPNTQGGLARHPSLTIKPLLNFDGDEDKHLQPSPTANRIQTTRSVFGVDTLWQREISKLKEIEAQEQKDKEARELREQEAELKKQRKKEKKKKGKRREDPELERPEAVVEAHIPIAPPTLPDIPRAPRRAPPKPSDSDISSESEDDELPSHPVQKEPSWHVDSSDEDNAGPRRTTGTGPRYPKSSNKAVRRLEDDDSEEDVPLAATIHKVEARAMMRRTGYPDSDDEDRPLSHVLLRAKTGTSPIKYQKSVLRVNNDNEDDDEPLGIRASRITQNPANAQDGDDMPLAFHPEQQRRTQYQMLAAHQQQQQQQQQQMMMHAQLQSNMMMNASMMGQPYFPPPMMNPMAMMGMQVPMPVPSPPPLHDEAKLSLVDRWRRDVVVDGENM